MHWRRRRREVGLGAEVERRVRRRGPAGRRSVADTRDEVGAREPQPRPLQRRLAAPPPAERRGVGGACRQQRRGARLAPVPRGARDGDLLEKPPQLVGVEPPTKIRAT